VLLGSAKRPITMWREAGDVVEQSGEQIWQAVSESVREAVRASGVEPRRIAGIGFDATCSLVAVAADGAPVTVSPSGDANRNVIVWMDHRAAREADEINAGRHDVLRYVGGVISPEMETPKLLWLKRHLPQSFAAAAHFFDLADYLTWRASGIAGALDVHGDLQVDLPRPQNSAGMPPISGPSVWLNSPTRVSRASAPKVVMPGTALGNGLVRRIGGDLGLSPGTAVAAALIDAHAGGVGTLGAAIGNHGPELEKRLAYIFGTSACSMASAAEPVFVPGVWGPYYSAMIPGLWLNEGGQSAAGAALDHLVTLHPAAAEDRRAGGRRQYLACRVARPRGGGHLGVRLR
jgi:ribulose kinase